MIYKTKFRITLYTEPSFYSPSEFLVFVEKDDLIIFLCSYDSHWIKVLHKGIVGYVYAQIQNLTSVTSADTLGS